MKNRTKAVAAGATLALVSAGLISWAEPTPFATGGGCTSLGTREPLRFRAQDNENSPTEAVTFSGTVSINGGAPLILNFIADHAEIDVSPSLSGNAVATITATWPSDSRTVTVAVDFAACELVTVPTTPTTEGTTVPVTTPTTVPVTTPNTAPPTPTTSTTTPPSSPPSSTPPASPPPSATPTPSPTTAPLPPSANPTISNVPGFVDTDQDGTISPADSQYAAAINSVHESG
jgi:hypothetical protein